MTPSPDASIFFPNEWLFYPQRKPRFFPCLLNPFNQLSSPTPLFLVNPHINDSPMQCVYFPCQLTVTSYKLKHGLPYQVSLSILGNMHNIDKVVSRKWERGLKKKRERKEKEEEIRRKTKGCKHPSNFAKRHLCRAPTIFPSLKVLFINVYNNSLEEKDRSAAKRGGVLLSQ